MKIDDEFVASLALNRVPGVGSAAFSNLNQYFKSASAVFNASRSQLTAVPAVSEDSADHIIKGIDATGVELDIRWLEESPQHEIILYRQRGYPELLARIHRPPPVLFLKGDAELLHTPQISIVGSRNPTPGGRQNAYAFSETLAACGLTITSGLAAGIDGAAHRGALAASNGSGNQGKTIAVAATGLDRIYPSQHRELAHQIVEQGLLISEFPVGVGPLQANFPRRNRVISGLSLGTLVVEAAKRSGSLISARCAMEQDREVFAIPGSIHSPQSRGCHWLIKQGAKLVETAEDIAEEILLMLPDLSNEPAKAGDCSMAEHKQASRVDVSAQEQLLVKAMGYDPVTLDSLISRTGMKVEEVSVCLSQLELKGLIDGLAGGRFCRRG